ncbi:zinc metalloproteinase nas-14-like [Ruditapes philippinarum]|uniref:zinc metalloproteinase nas-14-like n=1 Tax=Ruditapes philippinarum TaxID=129788 RepID=UPI00295C2C0C|nr:zinc metalloproteinase nas-14-like [Ruditapes philippinarum]
MNQGPQTIKLGETCFKTEIILHEIGHALGFYHEHNRWDRDDYIKIHYENIEPGKNQSFQKQENAVVDTNYDYLSIMHYGQYFFSRNESANLITIETKNDTFQSKIGMAKQPSFHDYKTLNVMFKCADLCPTIECPEAGFVGKNCKCYCKGNSDDTPVKLCNKTGECRRPTVNTYLIDVMGKDKNSTVSINRTSFPDKTVLNLVSTNWECTSHFQLRCEDGDWKEISIAECPVTLNISLTDETEGVVKVTLNGENDGYICDDDWDDNDATVACKMLGYTKGLAFFPKAKEVNESLPILLDNVQCSGEELSLADCKHNGWGNHDCEYLEVVSVKCFYDSYSNHINATTNITCGKESRE